MEDPDTIKAMEKANYAVGGKIVEEGKHNELIEHDGISFTFL